MSIKFNPKKNDTKLELAGDHFSEKATLNWATLNRVPEVIYFIDIS